MHRATPVNTSFRSYNSGGARATLTEIDDKKQMQEVSGSFMKGESRKKIERPQNYGFSSVPHEPDKDENGNVTECAEGFVNFMGGSRSMPVIGMVDDRRHRLKGQNAGDVALYRGKDDCQQFDLMEKGNFLSARNDRKNRIALVPAKKKESQSQGGSGGGGGVGARAMAIEHTGYSDYADYVAPDTTPLAADGSGALLTPEGMGFMPMAASAGGGGSGGGGDSKSNGQGEKKELGQKPVFDDNESSKTFFEQTGEYTAIQQEENKGMRVGKKRAYLRFGDFAFWIDDEGLHCTHPITQKPLPND